jgi:hypothetical protein
VCKITEKGGGRAQGIGKRAALGAIPDQEVLIGVGGATRGAIEPDEELVAIEGQEQKDAGILAAKGEPVELKGGFSMREKGFHQLATQGVQIGLLDVTPDLQLLAPGAGLAAPLFGIKHQPASEKALVVGASPALNEGLIFITAIEQQDGGLLGEPGQLTGQDGIVLDIG